MKKKTLIHECFSCHGKHGSGFSSTRITKDVVNIETRKNLQETAFFYPHLRFNSKDEIQVKFTAPQALTRWKFQLVAHTKNADFGIVQLHAVTKKDLVVIPNLPRFLREGDSITISSKISNLSDKKLNGQAYLQLINDDNGSVFKIFNANEFSLEKAANTSVAWTFEVPSNINRLRYKISAKTNAFTDGEEGHLDILKKKILVTETLPLFVKSSNKRSFTLDKLGQSSSNTLEHLRYSVKFTSNPSWLALESIPYLINYPYEHPIFHNQTAPMPVPNGYYDFMKAHGKLYKMVCSV